MKSHAEPPLFLKNNYFFSPNFDDEHVGQTGLGFWGFTLVTHSTGERRRQIRF